MADYGPNVTKLILRRMTVIAIPPGGGIGGGFRLITDDAFRKKCMDEAEAWTLEALRVVKTAPDNTYPNDEAIAGALLEMIEKRKAGKL